MKHRIGIDIGVKKSIEDGLEWAETHGLRYVDFRLETGPDSFTALTPARCAAIRQRAEAVGITIAYIPYPPSILPSTRPTWQRRQINISGPILILRRP